MCTLGLGSGSSLGEKKTPQPLKSTGTPEGKREIFYFWRKQQ